MIIDGVARKEIVQVFVAIGDYFGLAPWAGDIVGSSGGDEIG